MLRKRADQARDEVVRRAVRAVLHVDRARDLGLEARVAAAELVAVDPFPAVAEPLEALRLGLGVRHVLRLHHHIEPAVARVVALDRLVGDDSLEHLERLPAHRAEHLHAAVEVALVAVEVEVPEPLDELAVEPRLDVERRRAREHPLEAAHRDARPRERIVADREKPRVAAARAVGDRARRLAVEERDIEPALREVPRGRRADDACADDHDMAARAGEDRSGEWLRLGHGRGRITRRTRVRPPRACRDVVSARSPRPCCGCAQPFFSAVSYSASVPSISFFIGPSGALASACFWSSIARATSPFAK